MKNLTLRSIIIIIIVAMSVPLFFLPSGVGAALIDTYEVDYLDGALNAKLVINEYDQGGSWRYEYILTNIASNAVLLNGINVGWGMDISGNFIPPTSFGSADASLDIWDDYSSANSTKVRNFMLFNPAGAPVELSPFYVEYNSPLHTQNIAMLGVAPTGAVGVTRMLMYNNDPLPDSSVPEPGTLLLLGFGVLALGVFSRNLRIRKSK